MRCVSCGDQYLYGSADKCEQCRDVVILPARIHEEDVTGVLPDLSGYYGVLKIPPAPEKKGYVSVFWASPQVEPHRCIKKCKNANVYGCRNYVSSGRHTLCDSCHARREKRRGDTARMLKCWCGNVVSLDAQSLGIRECRVHALSGTEGDGYCIIDDPLSE